MNEQPVPGISYNIYWVGPHQVVKYWPFVLPFVEEAIRDPHLSAYTNVEWLQKLIDEQMQLWVVSREGTVVGAFVTDVYDLPLAKICNVVLVGGNEFEKWRGGAVEIIKLFAKKLKCDVVLANGRPGWKKWAGVCGFKLKSVIYELDLGENNAT